MKLSSASLIVLLLAGPLAACDRQSPSAEQAAADAPVTSGEATGDGGTAAEAFKYTIDRSKAGTPAPTFAFGDPDGGDATLADYAGKPVLVNLWATWCGPCVAEMPTLDKVAESYGPKGLAVLTIAQDLQPDPIVQNFFAKHRLPHLKGWTDPEGRFGALAANGLPTSILYDAQGKEMVRVSGAMDWNGAEAKALLDAAVGS